VDQLRQHLRALGGGLSAIGLVLAVLAAVVGDVHTWFAEHGGWWWGLAASVMLAGGYMLLWSDARQRRVRDEALMARFLQELPPNDPLVEWLRYAFNARHIAVGRIDYLQNWHNRWNDDQRARFYSRRVNRRLLQLIRATNDFLETTIDYMWTDESGEFVDVPPEWKGSQPEKYYAALNEIDGRRSAWLAAFDDLLRASQRASL